MLFLLTSLLSDAMALIIIYRRKYNPDFSLASSLQSVGLQRTILQTLVIAVLGWKPTAQLGLTTGVGLRFKNVYRAIVSYCAMKEKNSTALYPIWSGLLRKFIKSNPICYIVPYLS
jgi:hypothetical protein